MSPSMHKVNDNAVGTFMQSGLWCFMQNEQINPMTAGSFCNGLLYEAD